MRRQQSGLHHKTRRLHMIYNVGIGLYLGSGRQITYASFARAKIFTSDASLMRYLRSLNKYALKLAQQDHVKFKTFLDRLMPEYLRVASFTFSSPPPTKNFSDFFVKPFWKQENWTRQTSNVPENSCRQT